MLFEVLLIISGLFSCPSVSTFDEWIEPNAWELHSPSKTPDTCPICDSLNPSTNQEANNQYYKVMTDKLFDKNFFKKNKQTGDLERVIQLSLTPAQFEVLENASNVEDLNRIVMIVLQRAKELDQIMYPQLKSKESYMSWSFLKFIYYAISQVIKLIFLPQTRFVMFAIGIVMLIWFLHKRYNRHLILAVLFAFVTIGYILTYIECNNKLHEEELIELADLDKADKSYVSKFLGVFKPSERENKIQEIKDKMKFKLPFCRPDRVLIMYLNEIFFDQLLLSVQKISEGMNILYNSVPFPYNMMAMFGLPILFWAMIPLVFHYFLNPASWVGYFKSSHGPQSTTNNNTHDQDRLSGQNLQILLGAIQNFTNQVELKPIHSAVEDVKDRPQTTAKLEDCSERNDEKLKGNSIDQEINASDECFEEETDLKSELDESKKET